MLHKKFDFTKQGGFPLTQETLAFMQEAYGDLSAVLAASVGNNVIISGVEPGSTQNSVTDGFIVYNNELLPFISGSYQDLGQDGTPSFYIVQDAINLIFNNSTTAKN